MGSRICCVVLLFLLPLKLEAARVFCASQMREAAELIESFLDDRIPEGHILLTTPMIAPQYVFVPTLAVEGERQEYFLSSSPVRDGDLSEYGYTPMESPIQNLWAPLTYRRPEVAYSSTGVYGFWDLANNETRSIRGFVTAQDGDSGSMLVSPPYRGSFDFDQKWFLAGFENGVWRVHDATQIDEYTELHSKQVEESLLQPNPQLDVLFDHTMAWFIGRQPYILLLSSSGEVRAFHPQYKASLGSFRLDSAQFLVSLANSEGDVETSMYVQPSLHSSDFAMLTYLGSTPHDELDDQKNPFFEVGLPSGQLMYDFTVFRPDIDTLEIIAEMGAELRKPPEVKPAVAGIRFRAKGMSSNLPVLSFISQHELAVGDADGILSVYEVRAVERDEDGFAEPAVVLKGGHSAPITAMTEAYRSKALISGDADGGITVWTQEDLGQSIKIQGFKGKILSLELTYRESFLLIHVEDRSAPSGFSIYYVDMKRVLGGY